MLSETNNIVKDRKNPALIRLLFVICGLAVIQVVHAQTYTINGIITDSLTGQAVSLATVTVSAKNGAISGPEGGFSIKIKQFPAVLTVSHLAYGANTFRIENHTKDTILLKIQRIVTQIPEVFVSGESLQKINEGADFSVYQFEFDKYYMWMIGMPWNNPKQSKLYLANLLGDTLSSIPVDFPSSLEKDVFAMVHLVNIDSIYQLASLNNEIKLLYGEDRYKYYQIMRGYQATLGIGLVYYSSNPHLDVKQLFYIDSTMNRHDPIFTAQFDTINLDWLPESLKRLGEILGPRSVQQIVMQQRSYLMEHYMPFLFKYGDSVCVIDLDNDKIHTIGPDLELKKSASINFHHQPNPTYTNLYINYKDIIVDELTNDVYVVYRANNKWRFVPFNPSDGTTGNDLDVPDFNAMSNVRIHGGAIYFIYPEKNYPFFQRIYRKNVISY